MLWCSEVYGTTLSANISKQIVLDGKISLNFGSIMIKWNVYKTDVFFASPEMCTTMEYPIVVEFHKSLEAAGLSLLRLNENPADFLINYEGTAQSVEFAKRSLLVQQISTSTGFTHAL